METQLWAIGLMILGTIFASIGSLNLKIGTENFKPKKGGPIKNGIRLLFTKRIIISIVIYVIASILGIISYKGGELNVLYPLSSLTYVWVIVLSHWQLGEKMNKYKYLGTLAIILGVVLLTQ